MDVLAAANRMRAEGLDVVSLAVGQPSAPAPRAVCEAAAGATLKGPLGYTDALGRFELRQAIARPYGDSHGLDISPSRIAVTTGSSAGFALAFLSMFDVGDRIAIERPGYPAYRNILGALGLVPVELPCIDPDVLRTELAGEGLAGVLLASPANPTGALVPEDRLRDVATFCAEEKLGFISDEIYHRLTYDRDAETALRYSDQSVVINSFSKFYCMTGWRVGWMVLPETLVRPVERVAQSLYISAPDASQIGAVEAFGATDELAAVRKGYARNRDRLLAALPRLGFRTAASPDGAFYAWTDTTALTDDSMAFARRMLEEAHVAAPPGLDFDPPLGRKRMRFSYAGSETEIAEAVSRLERWIG